MEGLLVFLSGTVQPIGQVQDITNYIPVLENLVVQLKLQLQKKRLEDLQSLSVEELEQILKSRTEAPKE